MPDVILWPVPSDADVDDVRLRDPGATGGSFPTQFAGLRVWHSGAVVSLCLVATADAPAGMGASPRVRKGGTTYAVYLVETSDPDASPVRIRTSAGTKAARRLT